MLQIIQVIEKRIKKYAKSKDMLLTKDHWEIFFIILKYTYKKKSSNFKKNFISFSERKKLYTLFPQGFTELHKLFKFNKKNICI